MEQTAQNKSRNSKGAVKFWFWLKREVKQDGRKLHAEHALRLTKQELQFRSSLV